MMFYVIGSEDQSRVLLSTAPANRTKSVVEQFGTSGAPIPCRMKPTNYVSIWSNISIQLLCSGVPLRHYYTDNVLCRQDCESLSLYSELQRTKINGSRKSSLYLLGRFQEKYQRAKIILSNLGRIFKTNFPTTCREYKTHFQPSWSEVPDPTSAQLGQKLKITSPQVAPKLHKQLRHRLCWSCFYT